MIDNLKLCLYSISPMEINECSSPYEVLSQLYYKVTEVITMINNNTVEWKEYQDSLNLEWKEYQESLNNDMGIFKENLMSAFNDLKYYVDNYFDNLDVQEEINNKIEELINTGELSQILNEKIMNSKKQYYKTVSDLLDSVDLYDGCYVSTLGYYTVGDGGGCDYYVSKNPIKYGGFANGELTINILSKNKLNLKWFGSNSTTDSSPILYNTLKLLCENGGGVLDLGVGKTLFETPIIIDFEVFGVTIKGVRGLYGTEPGQLEHYGSILKYTGEDHLLKFNAKCNNFKLSDFFVDIDEGYFIEFNYTFHMGILENIRISGGRGAISLNTGTYVTIDKVRMTSRNPLCEYGVQIGKSQQTYTTEFIYIKNSSFDFSTMSNGNGISIYKIEGGLWCNELDIANTKGSAFYFNNIGNSSNYFNIYSCNFSGCRYGFHLIPTRNIGGFYIDNQRISLNNDDENERYILTEKINSNTVDLKLNSLYIRSRNPLIKPTYLMELSALNRDSIISINGGEKIDSPIHLSSIIKKYEDFRIESICINKDSFKPGVNELPLSQFKCMILNVGNCYGVPYSSGSYSIPLSQINFNDEGYVNAILVITKEEYDALSTGRVFIGFNNRLVYQTTLNID